MNGFFALLAAHPVQTQIPKDLCDAPKY